MRNSIAPLRLPLLTLALAASISVPLQAHAQSASNLPPNNPQISLRLQEADLQNVFQQIFKEAKVNYTIDPKIKGVVSAVLEGVPLQRALDLIVKRASPPLTYRFENGVYSVMLKDLERAGTVTAKQDIAVKVEIVLMAGKGEKTSKAVVSMLGRAPSAGTIKLQAMTDGKPDGDATLAVSSGDYALTLKPTFNSDGSIQIDTDATLDISYRLPGETGFQHFKTKLSGGGRYRAGDTIVFSSTVLKSQDDKAPNNTAELLIFLTPTTVAPRVAP